MRKIRVICSHGGYGLDYNAKNAIALWLSLKRVAGAGPSIPTDQGVTIGMPKDNKVQKYGLIRTYGAKAGFNLKDASSRIARSVAHSTFIRSRTSVARARSSSRYGAVDRLGP